VEVEVARRLEEREKERLREEEERRAKELQEQQQAEASEKDMQPADEPKQTLPSGVLTPLLKRHRDLDDELKARLQELEAKL
jgi:kinesin family member 22